MKDKNGKEIQLGHKVRYQSDRGYIIGEVVAIQGIKTIRVLETDVSIPNAHLILSNFYSQEIEVMED